MPENVLYFGDNLHVLREHIPDESVGGLGWTGSSAVMALLGGFWQSHLTQHNRVAHRWLCAIAGVPSSARNDNGR